MFYCVTTTRCAYNSYNQLLGRKGEKEGGGLGGSNLITSYFAFLQIIFDSGFTKSKLSNIAVPPGYSDAFSYVLDKTLIGGSKQSTSLYAPWMHVSSKL